MVCTKSSDSEGRSCTKSEGLGVGHYDEGSCPNPTDFLTFRERLPAAPRVLGEILKMKLHLTRRLFLARYRCNAERRLPLSRYYSEIVNHYVGRQYLVRE